MNVLSRATNPLLHFDDFLGVPLAGGTLCTFAGGKAVCTYKDKNGTLNPEEIRLNSRGEADVWLDPAVNYKFILKNALGKHVYTIEDVTANTRTFEAKGSATIQADEEVIDGKTIVTFKVKDGSIGFEELKDARHTIPDSHYLQFKRLEMNGSECIVVTLCEGLKSWLATQGYTYDE